MMNKHKKRKSPTIYGDILGMEVRLVKGMEEFCVLQLSILGNGQEILIYPKKDHQPATFTVLNFPVNDYKTK